MSEISLSDLFHRVGRILPEEQEIITIGPNTFVQDALDIMTKHNFNQIPIVTGNEVLGVFSYRSFAHGIIKMGKKERNVTELPVEAFCEDLKFANITDELAELIDEFDLKDAVLVGLENKLQGVVTTIDALRYFYEVASAYVMIREIELAIRELIRASIDNNELLECIDKCLKKYYEEKTLRVPASLEEMNLNDYVSILCFKGFWENFKETFGGAYSVVQDKLGRLPGLRNDIFHFKRDLTVEEYDVLRETRDWLLKRIRKLEASKKAN